MASHLDLGLTYPIMRTTASVLNPTCPNDGAHKMIKLLKCTLFIAVILRVIKLQNKAQLLENTRKYEEYPTEGEGIEHIDISTDRSPQASSSGALTNWFSNRWFSRNTRDETFMSTIQKQNYELKQMNDTTEHTLNRIYRIIQSNPNLMKKHAEGSKKAMHDQLQPLRTIEYPEDMADPDLRANSYERKRMTYYQQVIERMRDFLKVNPEFSADVIEHLNNLNQSNPLDTPAITHLTQEV